MILTSQERQALLTLAALLSLGLVGALWSEHGRAGPDRELTGWLNGQSALDSVLTLGGDGADEIGAEEGGIEDGSDVSPKSMGAALIPGPWAAAAVSDRAGTRTSLDPKRTDRVAVQPESALPAGVRERGRIRINVASASDLELLPGIGPAMARRLIEERDRAGPFRRLEDLRRVKGIGPKSLERLRDWVDCAPP